MEENITCHYFEVTERGAALDWGILAVITYIIYFVDQRLRLEAASAVSLIATPGE